MTIPVPNFSTSLLILAVCFQRALKTDAFAINDLQKAPTLSLSRRFSTVEHLPSEASSSTTEDRSLKAKDTWSTIALQPTEKNKKRISLNGDSTTVFNQPLFDEFTSIKGTYFINGLSSCQIGDRLVHPFEAHGFCKSLVFDGEGEMLYTSQLVETPLTKKERQVDRVINRGVMSTVANMDGPIGYLKNALSPSERDTANLTADLWPPPGTKNADGIEPVLITCTDNGEPYALDPKTLETKGRLIDVIPKIANIFPTGTPCLAHARYDEANNRFVMAINKMVIPGEKFKGNSQIEFIEFNDNFDVVSRRQHTSRFLVMHDWALSQNYYVVPKNPAFLKWPDIAKFTLGQSVGTDVFAMEEETNGEFILIPRHEPDEEVRDVKSDAFFNIFHFGPVFEKESANEMIIHGCVFDNYEFGGEMGFDGISQEFDPIAWGESMAPAPRLDQFVIDTDTFEMKRKERIPLIPVDIPSFDGDAKPCKFSFFLGGSRPEGWFPFRQLVKLDLESFESVVYDSGDGQVVSEPMLIPRKNSRSEDDGFVISIVHNAEEKVSKLLIFDSVTFEAGPIAECTLGDLIPWCVHGSFYPDYNP